MTDLPEPYTRPQATADLDDDLRSTVKKFHRLRWILVSVTGTLVIISLVVLAILLARQEHAIQATCGLYRDIGTVDITPVPPVKRPSRLTVTLVSHARTAYEGLNCSPPLSAPSQLLMHWARIYKINLP